MVRRTSRAALAIGLVAAPVVVTPPPAWAADTEEPTVEVRTSLGSDVRVDGVSSQRVSANQKVEVRWRGFTKNSRVVIAQCLTPTRAVNAQFATSWDFARYCAHQTRIYGTTGPDGTGSAEYTVKVGAMAGVKVSSWGGLAEVWSTAFPCNATSPTAAGSMCIVTVSECEWDQPLELSATAPWTLRYRAPAGVSDPARAAASKDIRFVPSDNVVIPAAPPRPIPGQPEIPELPPITGDPVGAPISGAGTVNTAVVLDGWLANVRRLSAPASVDFTRGTSQFGAELLRSGFQSGFTAGADFAVTGMPYEKAKVGGDVVYAPISLTGLAVANSLEYAYGFGVENMQLSPQTLARFLGSATQDWGGNDRPTAADNAGCNIPRKEVMPALRSGISAQNQVLSAWLAATLTPDEWTQSFRSAPGEAQLVPATIGFARSSENGGQTAFSLATNFGDAIDPNPDDEVIPIEALDAKLATGTIGYVDITEIGAQREAGFTPQVSPLKNTAGEYVAPDKDSILKAYPTMKRNADGTLTPTFDQAVPGAYPMPMAHYIAVPRTDAQGKNPLPYEKRKTLAAFIRYAVGDDAQRRIEQLGGAPLPAELREQARDVAEMLLRPDPKDPPEKPTPKPTPKPSSSKTPPPGGDDGGGGGGGGGGAGGGGGGGTTPPGGGPSTTPSPSGSSGPSATPTIVPVANDGTVRGGKIPGMNGVIPITVIVVIGALALLSGGAGRGYLIWRRRIAQRTRP